MQYKSLVTPSFLIFALELQEAVQDGWYIDESNLPATMPMRYYEAHLLKDENDAVKKVFSGEVLAFRLDTNIPDTIEQSDITSAPKKQAGRPPRVKQ